MAERPRLDIREYFDGELSGWGVVRDWRGRQTLGFTIKMSGECKDGVLVIKELLCYDSGKSQRREWTIAHSDERNFIATAPDVVGKGRGEQVGNLARMRYAIRITAGGREVVVNADDRMFLLADGRMINAAVFRKFGIKVGSLEASFVKGIAA